MTQDVLQARNRALYLIRHPNLWMRKTRRRRKDTAMCFRSGKTIPHPLTDLPILLFRRFYTGRAWLVLCGFHACLLLVPHSPLYTIPSESQHSTRTRWHQRYVKSKDTSKDNQHTYIHARPQTFLDNLYLPCPNLRNKISPHTPRTTKDTF